MTDILPPIPTSSEATGSGDDEVWPSAGPAKGLRIRLPIAIAALAVVGFGGAAAGASLKKAEPASSVQSGAIGGNRSFGNRGNGAAGANGTTGANGALGANGATGTNGAGGRFGGGIFGTVSKIEGNTVTMTQRDGTTATVEVPAGTAITKTVDGALSDLKAGTQVAVRGTTADGKTSAESITINPANGLGGLGGPSGANGANPPAAPGQTGTAG